MYATGQHDPGAVPADTFEQTAFPNPGSSGLEKGSHWNDLWGEWEGVLMATRLRAAPDILHNTTCTFCAWQQKHHHEGEDPWGGESREPGTGCSGTSTKSFIIKVGALFISWPANDRAFWVCICRGCKFGLISSFYSFFFIQQPHRNHRGTQSWDFEEFGVYLIA